MSRPFIEVLGDLHGDVPDELTAALTTVVAAVKEHRKPGTLTLKIGVAMNGETSVQLTTAVVATVPKANRPRTMMFIDPADGLRRGDPRQAIMPLRTVAEPDAEPKDIDKVETKKTK